MQQCILTSWVMGAQFFTMCPWDCGFKIISRMSFQQEGLLGEFPQKLDLKSLHFIDSLPYYNSNELNKIIVNKMYV